MHHSARRPLTSSSSPSESGPMMESYDVSLTVEALAKELFPSNLLISLSSSASSSLTDG